MSRTGNSKQASRLLLSQDDLRSLGINFSRQHLWRMIQSGDFPKPVALGTGVSARKAWRADEVEVWIANRPRVGDLAPDAA